MARLINSADFGINDRALSKLNWNRIEGPRELMSSIFGSPNADISFMFDDFNGKALDTTNNWSVGKDGNATNFVKTTGVGGVVAGIAGTTDGEGIALYGASADYYGDTNCGMECSIKFSYVTKINFEIGFVDAATNAYDPCVTDIDTPTIANGAVDIAVVAIDTAQTLTTAALVTKGSTPYTATTTALGTWAPTVSTFYKVRVQLIGDNVYGAVYSQGGGLIVSKSKALGIEGGTALIPRIMVSRVATSNITATLDYVAVWSDKY